MIQVIRKPNKKEIGDKWDEPLHIFFQGVININFKENMIGYTAGDKLTGTIDIEINENLTVDDLILEFVGQERTFIESD